jgi:hypothetical protein
MASRHKVTEPRSYTRKTWAFGSRFLNRRFILNSRKRVIKSGAHVDSSVCPGLSVNGRQTCWSSPRSGQKHVAQGKSAQPWVDSIARTSEPAQRATAGHSRRRNNDSKLFRCRPWHSGRCDDHPGLLDSPWAHAVARGIRGVAAITQGSRTRPGLHAGIRLLRGLVAGSFILGCREPVGFDLDPKSNCRTTTSVKLRAFNKS